MITKKIYKYLFIILYITIFNFNIISHANNERYELIEDNSLLIDNIIASNNIDIELKGDTLVNLYNRSFYYISHNAPETIVTRDYFTIENPEDYRFVRFNSETEFKKDVEYTFFINVIKNNHRDLIVHFESADGTRLNSETAKLKEGLNRVKLTVKEEDTTYFRIATTSANDNSFSKISRDIIVLKGDYSGRQLEYFEKIKSVGQNDSKTSSISITSKNKNIFDNDKFILERRGGVKILNIEGSGDNKTYTFINTGDNNGHMQSDWGLSTFYDTTNGKPSIDRTDLMLFNVKKGYKVYAKADGTFQNIFCMVRDKSNKYLKGYNISGNSGEIIIDIDNADRVEFVFNGGSEIGNISTVSNIQIGYGSLPEDNNIQSITNTLKINLKEPLRGLPNGIKDRIIKRNGQWVVERNLTEIILNGQENWESWSNWNIDIPEGQKNIGFYAYIPGIKRDIKEWDNINTLSDKFQPSSNMADIRIGNVRGIAHGVGSSHGYIGISISKLELDTLDIEGFKKWLSENNVTVVAQLETPIYEPLNIDLSLPIYEGTTYISNDSIIPAIMKVKVDRIINKSNEAVEEAIDNPTLHNISLARMWVNQMPESSLKDEMQMKLSNISNISDIQLDRKTTTSNLDVYIKCENILQMSLDTNSISFDDFSGIEDVEKINAVNVSINSSLPYQLNAYLPAEIQNADKSATMNKSILNIKESSETEYKEFTNLNEKVVLKDNCSSGNQLVHGIDIRLKGGIAHEKDVYKAIIKLEAEQK